MADSQASCVWEGNLQRGSGTTSVGSGAFGPVPVTWDGRAERTPGLTSPEEMIAAAHVSCLSMALSSALTRAGNAPTRLNVSAVISFVPGTGITTSRLNIRGVVPGIDQNAFQEAVEGAKANCPVSKALAGVEIVLESATLES